YPIFGYLTRSGQTSRERGAVLRTMLLAALISGVPLLATWGAVQWAPVWAHKLGEDRVKEAHHAEPRPSESEIQALKDVVPYWKEYTLLASSFGAILGCMGGALMAGWIGRR